MKQQILLISIFLLSLSFTSTVFAQRESSSEVSPDKECFSKVAAITRPKLDELRAWMRSKKARDGKTYYEVYRLYEGFRLNSSKFKPLDELADSIQLSASFAIGYCNLYFGDMDQDAFYRDPFGKNEPKLVHLSAHQHLDVDTLPKIAAFYKAIDGFVKNHYNKVSK